MKKILTMLLAFCLTLGLGTAMAQEVPAALAGTYILDASPLGMPLQVYLIIDESGNFHWTNSLTNGADKGSGMIGSEQGVYMMLYSDSTAEAMKTATFTVAGETLLFSTRVPYGSSGFSPNTENESSPVYPIAKKMVYEDLLGLYVGSLQVDVPAMGTSVTYDCELTLSYGAEYTLVSSFSMMGEMQQYIQYGTFLYDGGSLTLASPEKGEQAGTLAEGKMEIGAYLSAQGSTPRTITLQKATTAEAAGTYTGVKDMSAMGFVANATLTLDAVGGYTYLAQIEGETDYTEEGSFTAADGVITLQSAAEGAAAVEGTLADDVLTAKMRISPDVPMSTEIAMYSGRVQGVFTASTTDEGGKAYESSLTLNPNGTYAIAVTGASEYQEEGTFAVAASPMGTAITLTSKDGVASTGIVADTINITHNIDANMNTTGFDYAK